MNDDQWRDEIERDSKRLASAHEARRSLLAQTVFLGTLSVLFLVPVIGGAYLGLWLDGRGGGYSTHWTLSFIFLGIALGVFNVVVFVRRYW